MNRYAVARRLEPKRRKKKKGPKILPCRLGVGCVADGKAPNRFDEP